jgi:hypothetical protein
MADVNEIYNTGVSSYDFVTWRAELIQNINGGRTYTTDTNGNTVITLDENERWHFVPDYNAPQLGNSGGQGTENSPYSVRSDKYGIPVRLAPDDPTNSSTRYSFAKYLWEYNVYSDNTIDKLSLQCIEVNENMQVFDLVFSQDGKRLYALFAVDESIILQESKYQRAGVCYYLDFSSATPDIWQKLKLPFATATNVNPYGSVTLNSLDTDSSGNIYITTKISLHEWTWLSWNGSAKNISALEFGGAYVSTDNGEHWTALFSETFDITAGNEHIAWLDPSGGYQTDIDTFQTALINCRSIKVDSRNNDLIYMTTDEGNVLYLNLADPDTQAKFNAGVISPDDWEIVRDTGKELGENIIDYADMPFLTPTGIIEDTEDGWIQVTTACGGTWRMKVS